MRCIYSVSFYFSYCREKGSWVSVFSFLKRQNSFSGDTRKEQFILLFVLEAEIQYVIASEAVRGIFHIHAFLKGRRITNRYASERLLSLHAQSVCFQAYLSRLVSEALGYLLSV